MLGDGGEHLAVGHELGLVRQRTVARDHLGRVVEVDASLRVQIAAAAASFAVGHRPGGNQLGDPLDVERLIWQLDELHKKGISGVQVNYAHEDSPGWPTYPAEPPIFSDAWWRIWGRVADECRKRGMGIGLSTYTLDWPRGANDVLVVQGERERLIPFIRQVVLDVDLKGKAIKVDWGADY